MKRSTNRCHLVSPGGIILFHDIEARLNDYAVWRLWEELEAEYDTFHFKHGFGLGVLRKAGGEPNEHRLLQLMFDSSPEQQQELRQLYVHARSRRPGHSGSTSGVAAAMRDDAPRSLAIRRPGPSTAASRRKPLPRGPRRAANGV